MSVPTVSLRYRCADHVFEAEGLRCGLTVGPMPDGRMFVSISGTPSDVFRMALATIDAARGYGLDAVLRHCVENGVGTEEVQEVLRERMWTMPEGPE